MITDKTGGLPRYCHPYHGGWDVARIALDIPESRILFICPASCARIITLNAVRYNYKDRIDILALTEEDIVSGDYEQKTIDAACYVLDVVKPRPKALILYVSCVDAMLGNDHSFQTEEIMKIYPDVNCFLLKMCPITRYSGDLPMVALHHDMYAPLPKEIIPKERIVAFIGGNIALDPECELVKAISDGGYRPLHIQACDSYDDYLKVRASSLNMCLMPFAMSACRMLKERYGTPFLQYFARYDFPTIRGTIKEVCERLSIQMPDVDAIESETSKALSACSEAIGDIELVIDSTATLFPDALRKTLTDHGFKVKRVYADDISRSKPDIDSGSILMPGKRSYDASEDVIAIGMVASAFEGATKTVNVFYDNGEWGYFGLRKLAERILDAANTPRSAAQVRKEQER